MPDQASTCQVTKIEIGAQYMNVLLAGKPLSLSFPTPERPTHQFVITMDEATRKVMTNGVTAVEKAAKKTGPKKTAPASTRKKKPSR